MIDTREQLPLWTKSTKTQQIMRTKLDTGDYSILGMEDKICLERKSGADIVGSVGKGHKRFQKELARSLELDYFAIIIECTYTAIEEKSFDGGLHSKMKGDVVNSILNTITTKYKIPVFYCINRVEMKKRVKGLLNAYWKLHKPKVYTKDECGGV